MKQKSMGKIFEQLPVSKRMPVIFTSHGNPMDITLPAHGNDFIRYLNVLGGELDKKYQPEAVLVISAHWNTKGSFINSDPFPETIFDYYGFPKEYYSDTLKYPAPGSPEFARIIATDIDQIKTTSEWGFDHGNWPVMKHLFPKAEIPVLQLSIDSGKSPREHYDLALQLKKYREKGVVIIGSGAIVHNLKEAIERMLIGDTRIFGWEKEFDDYIRLQIDNRNIKAILEYEKHKYGKRAVPTPEHYIPLIYVMALLDKRDKIVHTYGELLPAFSNRSFMAESLG
ncbi:MAG: dioxygenase [Spirochaetes bacterium]|nr:MAG: dioxygenase [Spirochaetota bacterium]